MENDDFTEMAKAGFTMRLVAGVIIEIIAAILGIVMMIFCIVK